MKQSFGDKKWASIKDITKFSAEKEGDANQYSK